MILVHDLLFAILFFIISYPQKQNKLAKKTHFQASHKK